SIIRWVVGGFFAMFALVNGFHYSSILLLIAAFLMCPLSFVETFMKKNNIKSVVVIFLSIVIFFVAVIASPSSESSDYLPNETNQTTTTNNLQTDNPTKADSTTTRPNNTTTRPNNTTTKPNNTTSVNNTTTKPNNTTSTNTPTTKPNNTTSSYEEVTMVWVVSKGEKYHSKSNCSNMKSPIQISLENALKQNYTACQKCH
ncbi:MAG: hypothetical protein J6Q67_05210, partial [Clostridia bacterium]|nr:hypothetical protein [Clostridia bacterium]